MSSDTPLDLMVRQLDYLIEKLGEDHVGLGSDFDGAVISESIGSAAGLPVLFQALRDQWIFRAAFEENRLDKLVRLA